VSWFSWLLVVLWVTGLLPLILLELDKITRTLGGNTVSVRSSLEAIVTAVAVKMLALWVSAGLKAKLVQAEGDNLLLRKMAANVLRAALVLLGLIFALSAAGINLTALGVMGGVGSGLGLQKLAANWRPITSVALSSWLSPACSA